MFSCSDQFVFGNLVYFVVFWNFITIEIIRLSSWAIDDKTKEPNFSRRHGAQWIRVRQPLTPEEISRRESEQINGGSGGCCVVMWINWKWYVLFRSRLKLSSPWRHHLDTVSVKRADMRIFYVATKLYFRIKIRTKSLELTWKCRIFVREWFLRTVVLRGIIRMNE